MELFGSTLKKKDDPNIFSTAPRGSLQQLNQCLNIFSSVGLADIILVYFAWHIYITLHGHSSVFSEGVLTFFP